MQVKINNPPLKRCYGPFAVFVALLLFFSVGLLKTIIHYSMFLAQKAMSRAMDMSGHQSSKGYVRLAEHS